MKNIKEIIALICCCNLIFSVPMTMAAPQGGKVVSGSAQIHHSGATTTINQNSNRAVINWNSFDIGKNETVRHNMPSANSAGLHRVVGGGGASQILGQLQSNGNVYLVNPAGVVIHKGARIDTNSFTATSRDISNDNFMKGNMVFDKPGRPDAKIINQGTISVKENGLAALVAPTVRNDGVIAGKLAKVALASGDSTWKLDMHGDDLITFTVDEKDVDTLHAVDGTPLAGVENSGSIKAEGGVVVLTAAQLDGIVGSVVNSGEVSAASAELKGGKIVFKGTGSGVDIVNTGTVDASSVVADGGSVRMDTDGTTRTSGVIAATGGQQGGKVVVTGKDVALTGKAKLDVSGNKGGGTALVGGNALGKGPERNARTTKVEKGAAIVADARTKGDGGQVVVWSDEKTNFDGTITARGGSNGGNGGKVETSGKSLKVGDTAQVDTRASKGIHGQWLLDPMDFVIAASGGDISGATLSNSLASNNVEIRSEQGHTAGNGDIIVNDDISWAADTILTLNADRNVTVNADITATGNHAGMVINPGTGSFDIRNAKITLSGIDPNFSISGNKYTIIQSIQELQDINIDLNGYYALGQDIDAKDSWSWHGVPGGGIGNSWKGFQYIGTYDDRFSGILDGLGHIVTNFREGSGIWAGGVFYGTTEEAVIKNIGFESNTFLIYDNDGLIDNVYNIVNFNKTVSSIYEFGGLACINGGTIKNSHVEGNIKIDFDHTAKVGGLVGINYGDIIDSYSKSSINISTSPAIRYANVEVGGLVGHSDLGKISTSFSVGELSIDLLESGRSNSIGGFVGYSNSIIVDSFVFGLINIVNASPSYRVGGFVGTNFNGSNYIKNCYSAIEINNKHPFPIINEFSGTLTSYTDNIKNCFFDKNLANFNTNYIDGNGLVGVTTEEMMSEKTFNGWDFKNVWKIEEGKSYPYFSYATYLPTPTPDPDPTPTPDPDPTPTPDPDPAPTPNPDTGLNPGPDDDESAEGKYPGGGMVFYDELLGKHYLFKDNTKYYIITDEPTRVGGMSVINRTEMNGYEDKINSEIQNINEYYDELMKDATWDLGLTAIRIELSTILSALNPFDLMKGGVGVVGSLFSDAIKADEKVAYSNSYRLQCGYYLLLEQYLVNSNYYLQEAKDIYDNAVLNDRGLSAYEKRQISDLLKNSEKCLENAENIRNNKKEIESWFTTYAIGETSNDLFSLGLSSTLDAIPVKTSSDAEEILTNVVKEGSVNTVEESLDLGSINANDVFNLCTTNIPWNSEVGKVKKNFENSFNRTLNI